MTKALYLPRTGTSLLVDKQALIMGILNVTPDSFSDGGDFYCLEQATARALQMVTEGAGIIDIGGESTRPGSAPVSLVEQIARVVPVIAAIRKENDIPISIDTTSREVAAAALDAGADIINDISALRHDERLAPLAAERKCLVIMMHMQGSPGTMQKDPVYDNVTSEVMEFLRARRDFALSSGIEERQIVLDPGFGFGKIAEHNLRLMAELEEIISLGSPVLVGFSRKSTIGAVLDLPVAERLEGSLAIAVMAVMKGAHILRVHDVSETYRAVRMAEAVMASVKQES